MDVSTSLLARVLVIAWLLLAGPAATAAAKDAPAVAEAAAAPAESRVAPVLPADIPARADADAQFIAEAVQRAQAGAAGQRFQRLLEQRTADVQRLADRSGAAALDQLSVGRLETLHRHWQLFDREVTRLRADLARATQAQSEDAAQLAGRRTVWQATRAQAADSAPALLQRADELIALAAAGEQTLSAPLSDLLERGRQGAALSLQIQDALADVRAKIDDHDRRLLVIDTPPLWQALAEPGATEPVRRGLRTSLMIEQALADDHDTANATLLPVLAALGALLLPLMFWLKRRARAMVADGQASELAMLPLSQPWAAWLILVALGAMLYDQQGPLMRQQFVMLLAWLPVLVLVRRRVMLVVGPWAYLSALFYLFNVCISLLAGSPAVYRGLLLVLNLLMLATLAWLSRARRDPAAAAAERLTRWALWAAGAALVVSVGANVAGNVSLAGMLTTAVLNTSYLALAIYVGAMVVVALFQVLLARPGVSRLMGRRVGSLIPMAARLGRTLLIGLWLAFALQAFRIYRPLSEALFALLAYDINLGVLRFTPGNGVALVAATWLAFWLARTIRSLLSEDILPGLALPRGVSSSVSTLSYYSVLFIGLFAALAAAGFQVGELAIIFGALGVGIGFGLQDIVKNFVAGLILMFERPIQPGDVVDVAGMSGTVREIGLRATTLATFDGAAVVVPNGMLLADKMVNWTLSGNSRRISIPVNTRYAANPQETTELLVAMARSQPGIASVPSPNAILTGLLPGALEFSLRAWTTHEADWVAVRSELSMKIRNALAEAGIEVPMPQQEINLRGVSSAVVASLAAAAAAPPPQPGPA